MKKLRIVIFVILCVSAAAICGCGRGAEEKTFTLTYVAETGGGVDGEAVQTVSYGEDGTTVTAVPDDGYMFVRWSDGVTTPTRRDTNITADGTYTAMFAERTYAVHYGAGDGGRVDGEAVQTVPYGEDGTTVTAVPDDGYMFVRWSDGVTSPTRRDTNIEADAKYTAMFAKRTYVLRYDAGNGGRVEGNKTQTVIHGTYGTTVTAVPNTGYVFDKWSDGVTAPTRRMRISRQTEPIRRSLPSIHTLCATVRVTAAE